MLTSKTMETSTKHTKAKHVSWNLLLYVLKTKEESPIQVISKITTIFPWKVSPVQVIMNITTFATLIYSPNITILTRF